MSIPILHTADCKAIPDPADSSKFIDHPDNFCTCRDANGQQGKWAEKFADGSVDVGEYVDGKKVGWWERIWHDESFDSDTYIEGKLHKRRKCRYTKEGGVKICTYVNGKKIGEWKGEDFINVMTNALTAENAELSR